MSRSEAAGKYDEKDEEINSTNGNTAIEEKETSQESNKINDLNLPLKSSRQESETNWNVMYMRDICN